MLKVFIDTSPLANANSIRGVGNYTLFLTEYLKKINKVQVFQSSETKNLKFKPDIIHYPYFDLFFSTLPILKKSKTVVTVHDVIPLVYPDYYKPGKKGSLILRKQIIALKKADAIITDSESSKNDINKFLNISLNKIYVVPLSSNPELKNKDQKTINKIKRKHKLPKNYVLYVGDINYNKNIPQLIKTIKYLPKEIKLVCLGKNFIPQEIPEWKWIETQIALSDVGDRVVFIPNILGDDTEALSAIYSGAIAYIQPSLYEGFGLPILEAMSCKVPVVAGNNSSQIEVAGNHAILVEEKAENFANGVQEILAWSKTKRQKIVIEAYKWSKTFSWEATAKKTLDVYEEVLK